MPIRNHALEVFRRQDRDARLPFGEARFQGLIQEIADGDIETLGDLLQNAEVALAVLVGDGNLELPQAGFRGPAPDWGRRRFGRRGRLLQETRKRRREVAAQECAGVAAGWKPSGRLWEFGFRHARVSSTSWLYSQAATPPGSKS